MSIAVSMEYDMLRAAFCQSAKEASEHIKEMMQIEEGLTFTQPLIELVSNEDLLKIDCTSGNNSCWMAVYDIKAFAGFAAVTLQDNAALEIASSILKLEIGDETIELEKNDAIAELVNDMINCFLVYLAPVFGKKFSGSVPSFQFDDIAKNLQLQRPGIGRYSLLQSNFHIAGRKIRGTILLALQH